MFTTDGRVQDRRVDRPDLQLDGARVLERIAQRDLVPAQARRAHVDREDVVASTRRTGRRPALVSSSERRGRRGRAHHGSSQHGPGDAAGAVAAGARFRAVGVVDAQIGVRAGRARIVQHHELVEARARGCGDGARLARRSTRAERAAQVEHGDLVAETVHLEEAAVREGAHGRYMDRIRADRERRCRPVSRATPPPGKTFAQKKRPLLPAARSLGRKRPRRAAIRRRHRPTALQNIEVPVPAASLKGQHRCRIF